MWSGGDYEYPQMQKHLKKLERPVPGSGGQRITGLVGFVDELSASERQQESTPQCQQCGGIYFGEADPRVSIFMAESLFVLPEYLTMT